MPVEVKCIGDLLGMLPPRRIEPVAIPGMDAIVYVREISAAERDALESDSIGVDGKACLANIRGRVVALAACDVAGGRIFTDADAAELGKLPAQMMDVIYDAATRLAGMDAAAAERAKKNSGKVPSSDSSTS